MRRSLALMVALLLLALLGACGGGSTLGPPGPPKPPPPKPPPPPPPAGVTITTQSLAGATAGVPYTTTLTATGGTPPYKWDASLLPQGFSLSQDGVLSGTYPAFFGGNCCSPVKVRVTDSATTPSSATATFNLDVFGLSPASLTTPQVGVDFTQHATFVAAGGTLPIIWSISGTVPPGLVFLQDPADPSGRQYALAGTPTQAGEYQFSIAASDSGSPVRSETLNFQVQVEPAQLQLPHLLLPTGIVGEMYTYNFVLSGGAAPYMWSISSVQLPAGLQFDAANGLLVGMPTAAGYASFTVTLSDSSSPYLQRAQQNYWVLVTPNALPPRNDSIADATPIFPGLYNASISPYGDPLGATAPDEDYYEATAAAGATFTVSVAAWDVGRPLVPSTLDPVVEIIDATGQRYATCNDPYDDNPPTGVPITRDPTPDGFDDPCMNHVGDPTIFITTKFSKLIFQVPGTSGNVTFYIHVFDFRGDARPDMFYTLTLQ